MSFAILEKKVLVDIVQTSLNVGMTLYGFLAVLIVKYKIGDKDSTTTSILTKSTQDTENNNMP